jgi:hypothetical protein
MLARGETSSRLWADPTGCAIVKGRENASEVDRRRLTPTRGNPTSGSSRLAFWALKASNLY